MSLAKNSAFTLGSSLVQVLVILVTVPVYIKFLGLERYGVTVAVWLLFDYLMILNLGLDRALINQLSKQESLARSRSTTLCSGSVLIIGLGVLGGVIAELCFNQVLVKFLSVDSQLASEAGFAFRSIAVLAPFYMLGGALTAILQAESRFLELGVNQLLLSIFVQVIPLAAAMIIEPRLDVVLFAGAFARVAYPLVALFFVWGSLRSRYGVTAPALVECKRLLRYGAWISVTNILTPLLNIDRLLISSKLGPIALAAYNIPYNLVVRITVLPTSISTVLFPHFSKFESENRSRETLATAMIYLAIVFCPLVCVACYLIDPFLGYWLGIETASRVQGVGEILLIGIWFNGLAVLPYVYLQGAGRPRVVATVHALEVLPYLAFLWVSVDLFGLKGAAFAWSLRASIDSLALSWAAGVLRVQLKHLLVPLSLVVFAAAVGFILKGSILMELAFASLSTALLLVWGINAVPDERIVDIIEAHTPRKMSWAIKLIKTLRFNVSRQQD